MKRVYRITVVVERAFERTATRQAKEVRDKLVRLAESQTLWTVRSARISNRAKPERTPPAPTDAEVEFEIAKGQALAALREIADDMARILGNVKKPRIEFAPNRWCDGTGGRYSAHAHKDAGVRWIRGPRAGRRIPRGLICVNPRAIFGGTYSRPENWPELMAHELMHVRMPGGSHGRAKYHAAVEKLLADYAVYKEGRLVVERPRPAFLKKASA